MSKKSLNLVVQKNSNSLTRHGKTPKYYGIVDVNQFIEQNAIPPISASIKAKLLKMSMTNR